MAKNTDIRISIGFFSHNKTIKLQRKLGADAILALIQLWVYTAENKPEGILTGMDEEDIAIAAGWNGDAGDFVQALAAVRFLDRGKHFVVHDWADHNPWAAGAKQRSEKARKAAQARWGASDENAGDTGVADDEQCSVDATSNATSIDEHCTEHDLAMPPSFPSPEPSPEPVKPKKPDPPSAGSDPVKLDKSHDHHNEAITELKEQVVLIHEIFPDFNTAKFINTYAKRNGREYPAEVFVRVFRDLTEAGRVHDPWAFCVQRFNVHRQNVDEEDYTRGHGERKGSLVDLAGIMKGVGS